MALFFSQRNKPRKFEYIPRYYDPEQEERDKRRKQLRNEQGKPIEMEEYTPGSVIRNQGFRSMGSGRQRKVASGRPMRLILIIVALVVVAYFIIRWQLDIKF